MVLHRSAAAFDDSDGSDAEQERFVTAVTGVVQKLLREAEKKNKRGDVELAAFEALQASSTVSTQV